MLFLTLVLSVYTTRRLGKTFYAFLSSWTCNTHCIFPLHHHCHHHRFLLPFSFYALVSPNVHSLCSISFFAFLDVLAITFVFICPHDFASPPPHWCSLTHHISCVLRSPPPSSSLLYNAPGHDPHLIPHHDFPKRRLTSSRITYTTLIYSIEDKRETST